MQLQYLGFLATGFMLGIQHSLEPDHVAAVSTIVSRNRSLKKSALAGAVWGIGHTTTILIIGVLVLFLKITIPQIVAQFFEFCVGLVLIYLGVTLFKRVLVDKIHFHSHQHGDIQHVHLHSHKHDTGHEHLHKSFLIGMVHGLAGSAGIMLLILASMDTVTQGLLFALTFGVGSILGMTATGMLIGLPFMFAVQKTNLNRIFMAAIASVAVILGLSVLQQNWLF